MTGSGILTWAVAPKKLTSRGQVRSDDRNRMYPIENRVGNAAFFCRSVRFGAKATFASGVIVSSPHDSAMTKTDEQRGQVIMAHSINDHLIWPA